MNQITLDFSPEILRDGLSLLPHTIRIVGSRLADGYVRVVAESHNLPSGHYSVVVTDSASRRIVDIWPVPLEVDEAA